MKPLSLAAFLVCCLVAGVAAAPLGSVFTYQGSLELAGVPATGSFDFEVALFNVASGGGQIDVENLDDRPVTGGVFTLNLDYTGAPYQNGEALFLELRVRPGASTGAFTTLLPRQPLNAVPYAQHALSVAAGGGPAGRPNYTERNIVLGAGRIAGDSSLATGSDGLPFIAVHDVANGDLMAVHCEDITCATHTITAIDSTNLVGAFPSVLIARTGLPVIGYYDASNGDLRVAHCDNVACTSATTIIADATGDVGREVFAIYSRFGNPDFFYHDASNGNLKVVSCNSSGGCIAPEVADGSANDVGRGVSAAYSGFRLYVAYHNQSTGQLLLKVCGTGPTTCDGATAVTVDATTDSGDASAVLVPADGLPLILYTRSGGVRAARCTTLNCTGFALTANGVTGGARIAALIGADGMPYVFGVSTSTTQITRDRCGSFDCATVIDVINSGIANADGRPAMALAGHGLPQISHRNGNNLRLITCGGNDCDDSTRR